ncbi:hypothetical protein KR50_13670 [Jeotgalibacillus campisalis]|uniref:Uncharacterized protein n=1 Tax=Jeotgalibacillus campisalis TaxID=220754 RepID=A0A0C2VV86_9BACL|nr:hypothetical protein KR50_13670 [Jeotgalibacillus campisalis]
MNSFMVIFFVLKPESAGFEDFAFHLKSCTLNRSFKKQD